MTSADGATGDTAAASPDSPWLFPICVVLDLLVLYVVAGILVAALGAVLFKAIFGVV